MKLKLAKYMTFSALMFCAAALLCSTALAMPAFERASVYTQPDGSHVKLTPRGDEFSHWMEDDGGRAVVLSSCGRFEFARPDKNGRLQPTGISCSRNAAVPAGVPKHFKPSGSELQTMRERHYQESGTGGSWFSRALSAAKAIFTGWHSLPVSGERKLMVIRVSFADASLTSGSENLHMKEIWSEGDDALSIRQYYLDQSQKKLQIVSADYTGSTGGPFGLITVTLDSGDVFGGKHPNMDVASENVKTDEDNLRVHANECAVVSAILKKAAGSGIEFQQFDTDNDGKITPNELCVYMIWAGYEQSFSGRVQNLPMIWAHAWFSFSEDNIQYYTDHGCDVTPASHEVTINGKTLSDWAMNGELLYVSENSSPPMNMTGTMAHELGHQICRLPDLYDMSKTNCGLGIYSIMSMGNWGCYGSEMPGTRPTNLDAWSRIYLGWESPKTTVTASAAGLLTQFSKPLTNGVVRIESPKADSSEQYLLGEVRDPANDKWDKGMATYIKDTEDFAGGIFLQHVDERVGSGALDKGNDFNTFDLPHQGNMAVAADSDARSLSWSFPYNSHTVRNMWYAGNKALNGIGSLQGLFAGRTKFYAERGSAEALIESGIALTDLSPSGAEMTAKVMLSSASASHAAAASRPVLDQTVSGLVGTAEPLLCYSIDGWLSLLEESGGTDLDAGSFTFDSASRVTISEAAVRAAAENISRVFPLPVFKADSTISTGRLACAFVVTSSDLMAASPEKIKLLKVKGKNSALFFTYTDDPSDFVKDGRFTIMTLDNEIVPRGTALTDGYYRLVMSFNTQGGAYSISAEDGLLIDPCAIVSTESGAGSGGADGSGSSGGCDAGFGAMALLFAAALVPAYRKIKK